MSQTWTSKWESAPFGEYLGGTHKRANHLHTPPTTTPPFASSRRGLLELRAGGGRGALRQRRRGAEDGAEGVDQLREPAVVVQAVGEPQADISPFLKRTAGLLFVFPSPVFSRGGGDIWLFLSFFGGGTNCREVGHTARVCSFCGCPFAFCVCFGRGGEAVRVGGLVEPEILRMVEESRNLTK